MLGQCLRTVQRHKQVRLLFLGSRFYGMSFRAAAKKRELPLYFVDGLTPSPASQQSGSATIGVRVILPRFDAHSSHAQLVSAPLDFKAAQIASGVKASGVKCLEGLRGQVPCIITLGIICHNSNYLLPFSFFKTTKRLHSSSLQGNQVKGGSSCSPYLRKKQIKTPPNLLVLIVHHSIIALQNSQLFLETKSATPYPPPQQVY